MSTPGEVTRLLGLFSEGDRNAQSEVVRLVYGELRRLARGYMRRERPDHTLQPTALINEAYLRLVGQEVHWKNRSHFLGIAAQQMRRVLVDHARKHGAGIRWGSKEQVVLRESLVMAIEQPETLMAIHEALEKLASEYPRQASVVELRFFGGYAEKEIAEISGTSIETVKRDWQFAKTWLSRQLRQGK